MTSTDAIKWLENLKKDIGNPAHQSLWHYEQALTEIIDLLADRKGESQAIRCPKCGRTDYIRDMKKDMGVKGSHYKYKCINCNTYIKDEPQEREGE